MRPAEFWDSTPREAYWFIEAACKRIERESRLSLLNAYYAGAISRSSGDLPSFDEMFPERSAREAEPQAPEDALAQLEAWADRVNAMQGA